MINLDNLSQKEAKNIKDFIDTIKNAGMEINYGNQLVREYLFNQYITYADETRVAVTKLVVEKKLKSFEEISFFSYFHSLALVSWTCTENNLRMHFNNLNMYNESCIKDLPLIDFTYCINSTSFKSFKNLLLRNMHTNNSSLVLSILARGFKLSSPKYHGEIQQYVKSFGISDNDHFEFQQFLIDSFNLYPDMWNEAVKLNELNTNCLQMIECERDMVNYRTVYKRAFRNHRKPTYLASGNPRLYSQASNKFYKNSNNYIDTAYNLAHKYREIEKSNLHSENIEEIKKTLGQKQY